MNIKNDSIRVKTLRYLIVFSVTILLLLWVIQTSFLKIFYERYQMKQIENIAKEIIKTHNINDLELIAYSNDICIELNTKFQTYNYNSLNKDCILNSKSNVITRIKNNIINSNKEKVLYRLDNPANNSKSLIYGINYDDYHILLNTKLEDVNSTTNILTGQLIYITLIVIAIAIIVSYFVARMLNKPIVNITKKAKLMAEGNYEKDEEIYNISELAELSEVLNYARSEIKNTDEIRRDLLANVSHDLKTPLTMIKAYSEMARDINNNNEEKRTENLNIIIEEVDRLNSLVNDILELSKLENNKIELELEEYDLIEEIKQILRRYEFIKETKNYNIYLNGPDVAIVYADKIKINQVLYNLINNAINYTGDDLNVYINVKTKKDFYLIEVVDTGKGIDKSDIKFIWTKYYKNEKNHRREKIGTGLGLSIVREILLKHNFKFGVKSKLEKGSVFYFEIKMKKL